MKGWTQTILLLVLVLFWFALEDEEPRKGRNGEKSGGGGVGVEEEEEEEEEEEKEVAEVDNGALARRVGTTLFVALRFGAERGRRATTDCRIAVCERGEEPRVSVPRRRKEIV